MFIYLFGRLSCANIDGSSSTHQIAYWNALSRPPRCQNLFKTLSLFCNGTTFPSHQTTAQRRSHNNNPSWDMESLVKYNALGHKRAASSIQSQGCFKLFHYHWQWEPERVCPSTVRIRDTSSIYPSDGNYQARFWISERLFRILQTAFSPDAWDFPRLHRQHSTPRLCLLQKFL